MRVRVPPPALAYQGTVDFGGVRRMRTEPQSVPQPLLDASNRKVAVESMIDRPNTLELLDEAETAGVPPRIIIEGPAATEEPNT